MEGVEEEEEAHGSGGASPPGHAAAGSGALDGSCWGVRRQVRC